MVLVLESPCPIPESNPGRELSCSQNRWPDLYPARKAGVPESGPEAHDCKMVTL